MADRRLSSEYSVSVSTIKNNDLDTKFTEEEEKKARKMVYSLLFSDCLTSVAIIPSLIAGVAPIMVYWFVGNIISVVADYSLKKIENPLPQTLNQCIYLLIAISITAICAFFASMLWMRVGSRVAVRVRDQIFTSIMKYDVSFFDTHSIGSLLTILGEDAAVIQESFGSIKNSQIQNFAGFFVAYIYIYIKSWILGLIFTIFIPIAVGIVWIYHRYIDRNAKKRFRHIANSVTIAEEAIASIRTVRGFNGEKNELKRFLDETETARKFDSKVTFIYSFMFLNVMVFTWTIICLMLYFGAKMVGTRQNGTDFTSGSLVSVFGYAIMASFSLIILQDSLMLETRAIQSASRVLKLIEYQPDINFDGGRTYENFKGKIEFKNVTFCYPSRKTNALINVTFEINPGEYVALVGHSGSGKSTCVQLIERFYDVNEGVITVDGYNIKEIDPRWLHRQIALVSQEPTLFQGTIRENVAYGVEGEINDDEVWSALEEANAKKFVKKFTDDLDHPVGDRGTALSGGQRQRIAIARAVMKKPKVLICDEATSALDSESEKKVQEALDRIMQTTTGIVVAHRLSTVINCTKILVFDNGEIVERGTHKSLVEAQGFYYNLVKRQLQKLQEGN